MSHRDDLGYVVGIRNCFTRNPHLPASGPSQTTAHSLPKISSECECAISIATMMCKKLHRLKEKTSLSEQAMIGQCRSVRQSVLSIPCIGTTVIGCLWTCAMLTGPLCPHPKQDLPKLPAPLF